MTIPQDQVEATILGTILIYHTSELSKMNKDILRVVIVERTTRHHSARVAS